MNRMKAESFMLTEEASEIGAKITEWLDSHPGITLHNVSLLPWADNTLVLIVYSPKGDCAHISRMENHTGEWCTICGAILRGVKR